MFQQWRLSRRFLRCVHSQSASVKGLSLALLASALFTVVGVLVRRLSGDYALFQILLFRQVIFMLVLIPAILNNLELLLRPKLLGWHGCRVLGAFIALYGGFMCVSHIAFADATALGFLQVLFVAVLARWALKEALSVPRIVTLLLGFSGVMLVVRPSFEDCHFFYVLVGVGAAVGAALAVICVRKVVQSEPKVSLLVYQALAIGWLALIPSLFLWRNPSGEDALLLLLVGLLSALAQYLGVSAYQWAPANIVANLEYVKIIYAMLIAALIFSEIPDRQAILGAVIILLSAALAMFWPRRRQPS